MPTHHDRRQLHRLPPPNVAVQFLERVAKSPAARGLPLPRGRRAGSRSPGRRPATRRAGSPQACSRSASSPSSGSASPPARATSGSWPTSRSCAPAAPPRPSTPRTNAEDAAYILCDSECRVVFAEDDAQVAKLTDAQVRAAAPATRSSSSTARADGDWVISLDDLSRSATSYLAEHPGRHRGDRRRSSRDQLATLIYTSGTTGRPKGVRLRHCSWTYEGAAIQAQHILDEDDLAVPAGCRWPTRSARCCSPPSSPAASRPRSTAGSTRSSRTSRS